MEIKEYELQIAQQIKANTSSPGLMEDVMHMPKTVAKMPKLPYFKDGSDDMDAYLLRFERFATVAGWPEAD